MARMYGKSIAGLDAVFKTNIAGFPVSYFNMNFNMNFKLTW